MSESTSSEPTTGPMTAGPPPPPPTYATPPPAKEPRRPGRLTAVVAWVGIVAGVVFIVAVVFFSGFALGRHAGGYYGGEHPRSREFHHRMPMMEHMGPYGRGPMGQPEFPGPAFLFPRGPGMPQPPGAPTTTPSRP